MRCGAERSEGLHRVLLRLVRQQLSAARGRAEDRTDSELAQLAKTVGVDANAIACIKSGDDVGTAKAKAASAATTLSGLNASGTPFVWDGNKAINYQDPGWLTRLIS